MENRITNQSLIQESKWLARQGQKTEMLSIFIDRKNKASKVLFASNYPSRQFKIASVRTQMLYYYFETYIKPL